MNRVKHSDDDDDDGAGRWEERGQWGWGEVGWGVWGGAKGLSLETLPPRSLARPPEDLGVKTTEE